MFSSVLLFFEFTAPEIMLILFVVLLLFGGEKLPQLARGLGKGIREFKDASEGVKREITNQIDTFEAKKEQQAAAAREVEKPAENSVSDAPVAPAEAPAVIEQPANTNAAPVIQPPANTMPVAEFGTAAHIEPVNEQPKPQETHLRETPLPPADENSGHNA